MTREESRLLAEKFSQRETITIGFKGKDQLAIFYVLGTMGSFFEPVDEKELYNAKDAVSAGFWGSLPRTAKQIRVRLLANPATKNFLEWFDTRLANRVVIV